MQTTAILSFNNIIRLFLLVGVLSTFGILTLQSKASTPLSTVTISNDSGLEIRHLYLSPADNDNWGGDQLNGAVIAPGATYTLNVSWNQPTVKIVAEDHEGCFLSTTVDANSNSQWTIDASSARNCGS